jgi:hypothetical protein
MTATFGCLASNQGFLFRKLIHRGNGALSVCASDTFRRKFKPV